MPEELLHVAKLLGIHSSFTLLQPFGKMSTDNEWSLRNAYRTFTLGDYSYQGLMGLTERGARETSMRRKITPSYVIPL